MENYFTDYETLGKVADQLIAKKFPHQPPEDLASLREKTIEELDDQIGTAIVGSLSREQFDKFNALLDQTDTDPQAFQDFFSKSGVDPATIMTQTIQTFSKNFLGGDHA